MWQIVFFLLPLAIADPWSLSGLTGPGPDEWAEYFPLCNGTRQSPIDVPADTVYDNMSEFSFVGYDTLELDDMTIENNGYSAAVIIKDESIGKAYFTGGGFSGKYLASRFHFHWGPTDTSGSDHAFEGRHYAAAVHMGHFKEDYGTIFNSLNYPDGLAALVHFFELDEGDNSDIEPYISATASVPYKGDTVPFGTSFDSFMPQDTSKFYKYNGSMPLPPCREVVVWTLFKHASTISSTQLAKLRQMYDRPVTEPNPHPILGNQRPIQPLYGRTVYRNFQNEDNNDQGEDSDNQGEDEQK